MRSNSHAGFGERSGETDRAKSRHRAPDRLYPGAAMHRGYQAKALSGGVGWARQLRLGLPAVAA